MDIKSLFKILLVPISLGTWSGCGASFECVGGLNHNFQQNVIFTPEQLQYHIGDTIWISTKFSCIDLLDQSTGKIENFCGLESISTNGTVVLLEHDPIDTSLSVAAIDHFKIVEAEGLVTKDNNNRNLQIAFQIKDDEYRFKIGFIPLTKGKYKIFCNDAGPFRLPGSDRCDTGGFGLNNKNSDNHIELLEEYKKGKTVSDFERTHDYCFEVIE